MILSVSIGYSSEEIDIAPLISLSHVLGEADLTEALVVHLSGLAISAGVGFDEIQPDYISGDSSDQLCVKGQLGRSWVEQVAKLSWHVSHDPDHYLAYIDNVGWDYFDFDSDLDGLVDDEYMGELTNPEDFGREFWEDQHGSISEDMDRYFDFEQYGQDTLDNSYTVLEWGYKSFIFTP